MACGSVLEGEQQQEGHHKTEETHGLRQGKAQDGIGEQLLLQGWVPGIADDQAAEHTANTSTRAGDTDCSSSSSNELCRRVNVPLDCAGLEAPHNLAKRPSAKSQSRDSGGQHHGLALVLFEEPAVAD